MHDVHDWHFKISPRCNHPSAVRQGLLASVTSPVVCRADARCRGVEFGQELRFFTPGGEREAFEGKLAGREL